MRPAVRSRSFAPPRTWAARCAADLDDLRAGVVRLRGASGTLVADDQDATDPRVAMLLGAMGVPWVRALVAEGRLEDLGERL